VVIPGLHDPINILRFVDAVNLLPFIPEKNLSTCCPAERIGKSFDKTQIIFSPIPGTVDTIVFRSTTSFPVSINTPTYCNLYHKEKKNG